MIELLDLMFPPDPGHLRALRRFLRRKLDDLGCSPQAVANVVLVVDEIVTNAIEHAEPYRLAGGRLRVRLEAHGQDLVLDFEDPDVPRGIVEQLARALAGSAACLPPPESERGRGLRLIACHMGDLHVRAGPQGGLQLHGRFPGTLA